MDALVFSAASLLPMALIATSGQCRDVAIGIVFAIGPAAPGIVWQQTGDGNGPR